MLHTENADCGLTLAERTMRLEQKITNRPFNHKLLKQTEGANSSNIELCKEVYAAHA